MSNIESSRGVSSFDFSLFDNFMLAAEHDTNTFYTYRILQD